MFIIPNTNQRTCFCTDRTRNLFLYLEATDIDCFFLGLLVENF